MFRDEAEAAGLLRANLPQPITNALIWSILLAEMMRQDGGIDELRQFVVYVAAAAKSPERWNRFAEAVRRDVPGGEEVMTDTRPAGSRRPAVV